MDVRFRTDELAKRYQDHKAARRAWGEKVAVRYAQRVNALYAAERAEDLFALRSLALHPLKGDRQGQHALRLDDSWRLVVRFAGKALTVVTVEEVTKHYGD
jgi:plasmid maintenance system killer protein